MSTCGFRGRGFPRRNSRPNGPAGGFAGPRFPRPNFDHSRPPPKRLPAPDKWGEPPGGFPPWQGNNNFQPRPQFRGNIHFRPNGRGRMPNGRGMVRFSGPGRPPGPQFPMGGPIRPPMRPRLSFVQEQNTREKPTQLPHPGSQEERQQKICETADKLKQKLSSITQEEIMHFWEEDYSGESANSAAERDRQEGSKGIAELKHGPPELDLSFTDLKNIGKVNTKRLEGQECSEEIDLVDECDNDPCRYESINEDISVSHTSDNDIMVIPSIDGSTATLNTTSSGENKSQKGASTKIPETSKTIEKVNSPSEIQQTNFVSSCFDDNSEHIPVTNKNVNETVESVSHLLNDAEKETSTVSVPQPVQQPLKQPLKQANILKGKQEDSLIRKETSKSPSISPKIAVHKQKCVKPVTDVCNENLGITSMPGPLANNESKAPESNTMSCKVSAAHACKTSSGLTYAEAQPSTGSGPRQKLHNELPSFVARGQSQQYRWQQKASNCFNTGPQKKPEHSSQMPLLRPRMPSQQINPASMTFAPPLLAGPFLKNSPASHGNSQKSCMPVTVTDLPLNFDPAKPPPNIIPPLRSNKANLEGPSTFNTRSSLPHMSAIGTSITDNLLGFKHKEPPSNMYNQDDCIRPQQMYSPRGFLDQSNLITITPTETIPSAGVPISLMDMTPVPEFSLEPGTAGFVQLPPIAPTAHQPFIPNMQMNFSPIVSRRNTAPISRNMLVSAPPPIKGARMQAALHLPEESLRNADSIDDQRQATINDGLEDMQEAMKFASQIMNLSEPQESTFSSDIPLPNVDPPQPKVSQSNNESLEQSNFKIEPPLLESANTPENPKSCAGDVYVAPEKNLDPRVADKTSHEQDTAPPDLSLIDELMRPKVIFNLNSKLKRISKVEDWHHQNEEARQRKAKAINQTTEGKKVPRIPCLQITNPGSGKDSDPKKKTSNKTSKLNDKQYDKRNNPNTEPKTNRPRILEDVIVSRPSEKVRASLPKIKAPNYILSQKLEKLRCSQKPGTTNAELSWKNRVISRFLKMSKNDIRNMVDNSSLRKFDIAMKHLVKEKKSSLSLELRNSEDEKIKGYDQEEFMNQLNAMLDPGATVDITNLPTAFIHHLSEVLHLDPMPFDSDILEQSLPHNAQATESDTNAHCSTQTASANIIPDELSRNSIDAQPDSKSGKVILNETIVQSQSPPLESKYFAYENKSFDAPKMIMSMQQSPKRTVAVQESPSVLEEMGNEASIKSELDNAPLLAGTTQKMQRLLFNAADLDDILSEVADKPMDVKESEEPTIDYSKDNTILPVQESVNDDEEEYTQNDDYYESLEMKMLLNRTMGSANARFRKSTSEDRATFRLEKCQKWSRKEREDLDAFRNLTKEEWEAKHGKGMSGMTAAGSRQHFYNTGADTYGIIRKHQFPERQCLSETSMRNMSLSPDSTGMNPTRTSNCNGFPEAPKGRQSRSMSTSSTSSSSENERDTINPDVTKLLKVIKEKEKIAKKKSINETIRDEVTAEIEKKRKERSKYKEKRSSSKHAKRRSERRGKHRKRAKGKKKKRELKSCSTETEDEWSDQHLLAEDEIKKEIVVKEEVLTSPEKNLSPNGIAVNSRSATTEIQNIIESSTSQITEQASQLQATTPLSAGERSTEHPNPISTSPCAMLTLLPKTKAQLKQMPESANIDQVYNAEQPCRTAISVRNQMTVQAEVNKAPEKHVGEMQTILETPSEENKDQAKVVDSFSRNGSASSGSAAQVANINDDKHLNPKRPGCRNKGLETNRIDDTSDSSLTLFNPKMPEVRQFVVEPKRAASSPGCFKLQKSVEPTSHGSAQNSSKSAAGKPKRIAYKAYKERALKRRLREQGKLEELTEKCSISEKAASKSSDTPAHMEMSVNVNDKSQVYEPSASKDSHSRSNVTELVADPNHKDPQEPKVQVPCANVSKDSDNASANSMKASSENSKSPSKALTPVANEVEKSVKQVEAKAEDAIKKTSTFDSPGESKAVVVKKQKVKKHNRRRKSSNKNTQKDLNLAPIEKPQVQELTQVDNTLESLAPRKEKGIEENCSNEDLLSNCVQTENKTDTNNSKTPSTDITDGVKFCHIPPAAITEDQAKYPEDVSEYVEEENRLLADAESSDVKGEVTEELHFDTRTKQDLTSTEEERRLPTLSEKECLMDTTADQLLIRADETVSFEQHMFEMNKPAETQTKDELLSLKTNITEDNTLQYKIQETILKHDDIIDSNQVLSGLANDDTTTDLESAKKVLLSHTNNTKEPTNKHTEISTSITPESSNSPFAGFDQECNQDYIYNERIACLDYGHSDNQLPCPSRNICSPNITENLLSQEAVTLPRVTSEVTVKTSLNINGLNDNSIFNEDTMDNSSLGPKELCENSKHLLIDSDEDHILTNEIPIDPSFQDRDSLIVLNEYISTEHDHMEEYLSASAFNRDYIEMDRNSCDGDDSYKLHPTNFTITSPKDHDYSSKHHVVSNTVSEAVSNETPVSPITEMTSLEIPSANIVHTGGESQRNLDLRIAFDDDYKESNNPQNLANEDLLAEITNELNRVESITTPLQVRSSEQDNCVMYNMSQEEKQETLGVLSLDSSCSSMEVPKKLNVPTKAALKASSENIFQPSISTSSKDSKDVELSTLKSVAETLGSFQRTSLSIEDRDLSRASKGSIDNPAKSLEVPDLVGANDDHSSPTSRSVSISKDSQSNTSTLQLLKNSHDVSVQLQKLESTKQPHERTHKTAEKNTKHSKGEQMDDLHKLRNKTDLKRKHGKKQNISEKTVSDALKSGLVQVGQPNTKESVMARMIEIDLQIHKLMSEKMKLYQMLETDAVPSEAACQISTPVTIDDQESTPSPSVLASQLVQKIDVTSVLHQPVHKTLETIAPHNVQSTQPVKRKSSARKDHGHRKRIALSYSSDEEDTNSHSMPAKLLVPKKIAGRKDDQSLSRASSTTPERVTEKKRHTDKHSRSDGSKSSRYKPATDPKEDHSERKSAKAHKPHFVEETKRKLVSPSMDKKGSKKGQKDKLNAVKTSMETDSTRRKSEIESDDNNQSSLSVKATKNDSSRHSSEACVTKHAKSEDSSETPREKKVESITGVSDENVSSQQALKSCEEALALILTSDTKKTPVNEVSLDDKPMSLTPTISDARTSEGLSIYSDDSTWESFLQNAPEPVNEQKKTSTGLALLEMSYKKEMAKWRKMKAQTRKKKKKQPDNQQNFQTVSALTSEDEELSLSTLFKKKLQQKANSPDSADAKVEDPNSSDNQMTSQNLDEVINAVAENRVEDLYAEKSVLHEKSDTQEEELHTDIVPEIHAIPQTETLTKCEVELKIAATETERLNAPENDTHTLLGGNNAEGATEEKVAEEVSPQVMQNIDLPVLQKTVVLNENKINECVRDTADEECSVDKKHTTEMPELSPSSMDKSESIARSKSFIEDLDQEGTSISAQILPENASNSPESTNAAQSFTNCPEERNDKMEVESLVEESICMVESELKTNEENKVEKSGRKKKGNSIVAEESFKPQRLRKDSTQSTDTMTTDSNSGTNQELPRRKYMKRKRKNDKPNVRKSSRLTVENVKRLRLDKDASLYSNPDTDNEAKGSVGLTENKSLEESSKQSDSVVPGTRKRSTSTNTSTSTHKSQRNRKRSTNARTEDAPTLRQVSTSKKQSDPQLHMPRLKNCEVRLVDSKYTLLKANVNPSILRKYGISKINQYLDTPQNTGDSQTLSPQSTAAAEPIFDACSRQQTVSVAEGNQYQIRELLKDTSEIQVIKQIDKQEDSSKVKPQIPANDITPVHERRHSRGDEISVTPARSSPAAIIQQDSEIPDIEIVQELNPTQILCQDGSESTLSVIEPSDDADPPRKQYTVHKGPILDIKVFGNTFLAASEDGTIYRYSQASNGILNMYKGHKAAVTCLFVYGVGLSDSAKAWMFSGSLDGSLRCYNITTGAQIRDAVEIGSPVQCLDEAWGIIFIGTKSGHVSRYHIKSGVVKGESIQFSDKSVLALKATNEGSRRVLIVASRNQPITIRDAQTGLFLRTISGQKSHTVYSLMQYNNLIYCGTSSTSIPVFDFTDGEEIVQYNAGVGIVCMRLYSNLLFAGCYDGNIYVFNTKDHRLICSTPGPGNMLLSMEIVDNKIIAGSKDRRLQSWQMPKQVRSLLLQVT